MNHRSLTTPTLALLVFTAACAPNAPAPDSAQPGNLLPVARLAGQDYNLPNLGPVAVDRGTKKLYYGAMYSHDQQRLNLWVFDLDPQGQPTGEPRQYADHPDPLPKNCHSSLSFITVDSAHHRLYFGVAAQGPQVPAYQPLVMYQLDADGEPVGDPQPLDIGNPNSSCMAVAFHPRLRQLWAVGWGAAGLGALALDTNGAPAGAVTFQALGSYGKHSVGFRSDGSKVYCGTYPNTLEVADLDPTGTVTNAPRAYAIAGDSTAYLTAVNTDQAVYFRGPDSKLCWFALDADGEPVGDLRRRDDLSVGQVALSPVSNRLVVTALSWFPDAFTGEPSTNGAQVVELELGPDGAPGAVTRQSDIVVREEAVALGAAPAVAVATKHLGYGFLGNRFSGLYVRPTLVSAAARGPLPPAPTIVTMPGCPDYLRFDFSAAHQRVYAAATNGIATCALGEPEPIATNLPCPDLTGSLVVDDRQQFLYAAVKDGMVVACRLDDNGLPVLPGQTLRSGLGSVTALALHPETRQLYAIGPGPLAGEIDPRLVPVPSTATDVQGVIDPGRRRLYVISQYNGRDNLAVWPLTAAGRLAADQPRRYTDGLPAGKPEQRGILSAAVLDPRRQVLHLGGALENPEAGQSGIVSYTLDDQGDPTGAPRFQPTPSALHSTWALAVSNDGERLYEGGWGSPHLFAWRLGPAGEIQGPPITWLWGAHGKANLLFTPDGKNLLLGTHPGLLEVLRCLPGGGFVGGLDARLGERPVGTLRVGTPGDWLNLDASLKDGVGPATVRWTLTGATVTNATVRFEVAHSNQTGQLVPVKTIGTDIGGNTVAFFAPRYGIDDTNQIAAMLESVPERFQHYLALAKKYAIKPADRPKQFIVANGLISVDSSRASLETGLELLAMLGHNTVELWPWGNFDPADVRATAKRYGFDRFRGAVYNPPSYFDFNRDLVQPEYLDNWAAGFEQQWASQNGTTPTETILYHIGDEPGWYYPGMIDQVATNAARLAVFHEYLRGQGFSPALFGQSAWDEVKPIRLSQATTLPQRRLLYWTARFYIESFSRGFTAATAAMQRQFNPDILTGANLNNWPGRFFVPSPGKPIANNPDHGSDAAEGMPDWFDLGRKQSVTCMWTEDWFGDRDAQQWSIYADLLRCSAREGGLEYGSYVVGQSTGGMRHGGRYKIMALAGHGAKAFDYYIFGPNPAFGDGWSEGEHVYRSLADGTRMLGRAERLLYPGRPRDGTVAILFTQASQVWDPDASAYSYFMDLYGLHAALVHEQYPVDFIDDYGVEAGDLQKYPYQVLYVCGPNLSVKAQRAIAEWVSAGGTLVLLPGAAMADQYNEPTTEFVRSLGLTRDPVPRAMAVLPHQLAESEPVPVTIGDDRIGPGTVAAHGQVVPINRMGIRTLAKLADGSPVVAEFPHGGGRVFLYGYWPGQAYWLSPDRSRYDRLPQDWSAAARRLATAPARLTEARQFVRVDLPGVEACLLESDQGLAITLLNWTGQPASKIWVTVPETGPFSKIESLEQGSLKPSSTGDSLELGMPLETVDVLLLTR